MRQRGVTLRIVKIDELLEAFDDQLADAIKARRRACGLVCWGTRAAAAYGVAELIRQFAGGGGGS